LGLELRGAWSPHFLGRNTHGDRAPEAFDSSLPAVALQLLLFVGRNQVFQLRKELFLSQKHLFWAQNLLFSARKEAVAR
jgi:hypothetical protein